MKFPSDKDNKPNLGFWAKLPEQFSCLAPMEDVTDVAFRSLLDQIGRPDVFFTEFTSISGFTSPEGKEKVAHRLRYDSSEHPIVVQIWGKEPEEFSVGVKEIVKMGFDGIDINMGCPVKKIIKQGCCSALIEDQGLASDIIDAVKESAGDTPVSVKTRIGFSKKITEEWGEFLLGKGLAALTIHGRVAKEMSKFPADWDEIKKIADMRDSLELETLIIGNGDITSLSQGREYCEKYGVDGFMVGRGIFKDPWLFNKNKEGNEATRQEKIDLLITHLRLYAQHFSDDKNFLNMRKFYKMYIRDLDGAPDIRKSLMGINSIDAVIEYLTKIK